MIDTGQNGAKVNIFEDQLTRFKLLFFYREINEVEIVFLKYFLRNTFRQSNLYLDWYIFMILLLFRRGRKTRGQKFDTKRINI